MCERVTFMVRGTEYELDLRAANVAKFDQALEPYIKAASTTRPSKPGARQPLWPRPAATSPGELAAIRAWARNNGHPVAQRGRLAAGVVAAFKAAHS